MRDGYKNNEKLGEEAKDVQPKGMDEKNRPGDRKRTL